MEIQEIVNIEQHLQSLVAQLEADTQQQQQQNHQEEGDNRQENTKDLVTSLLSLIKDKEWEQVKDLLTPYLDDHLLTSIQALKETTPQQHIPTKQPQKHNPSPPTNTSLSPTKPTQLHPQTKAPGLFSKILPFLGKKKEEGNFTPMILPQSEQKYHFDKELGRYVFEGEVVEEEAPPPPPPKRENLKKVDVQSQHKPTTQSGSEMDTMTAPPTFSRGKKKAGKEKSQLRGILEIPSMNRHDSVGFGYLQEELRVSFRRIRAMCESMIRVTPLEKKPSETQLDSEEVIELMKESYELLLKTSQWSSEGTGNIVVNRQSFDNDQESSRLRDKINQLERELSESHIRLKGNLEDLSQHHFQHQTLKAQTGKYTQDLEQQVVQLKDKCASLVATLQQRDNERTLQSVKEVELLQKEIGNRDHIISLLENNYNYNETLVKNILSTTVHHSKLSAAFDECLNLDNSLLERVKSKQQKLTLISEEYSPEMIRLNDSSSRFLSMSEVVKDITEFAHTTLYTLQGNVEHVGHERDSDRSKWDIQRGQYQSKISNLKSVVAKQKAALDSCKMDNNTSNDKSEALKREKLRLENELDHLKHDTAFRKGLLEQSNNKYVLVSKKSETQTMKLQNITSELAQLKKEFELSETRNAELVELSTEIGNEKEKLEEVVAQLEQELDNNREELRISGDSTHALISELSKITCEKEEANMKLIQLEEHYTNQQEQIQQLQEELQENQLLIERLDNELNSKEESFQLHQKQSKQLQSQVEQLSNKIESTLGRNNEMETTLQMTTEANSTLHNEIHDFKKEISACEGTILALEEEVSRVTKALKQQQETAVQKDKDLQDLNQVLLQLQEEVERETLIKEEVQSDLNRKKSTEDKQRAKEEQLQQKLAEKEQKEHRMSEELQEARRRLEIIAKEQQSVDEAKRNDQLTIQGINGELQEAQKTQQSLTNEINALKEEISVKKGEIASLQESLSLHTSTTKSLQEQTLTLTAQNATATKQLEESEELIEALQQELVESNNEKPQLQSQLLSAHEEVSALERRLEEMSTQPSKQLEMAQSLRQKIEEQEFEMMQIKEFYSKKLDECEARIGELLEDKQSNTVSVAEINNKYQKLVQDERENSQRVIDQLKLDILEVKGEVETLSEKDLKQRGEIEELVMILQKSEGVTQDSEQRLAEELRTKNEQLKSKEEELKKKGEEISRREQQLLSAKINIEQLNQFIRDNTERSEVMERKLQKLEIEAQAPKPLEFKKLIEKVEGLTQQNQDLLKQKVELMRSNELLIDTLAQKEKQEKLSSRKPSDAPSEKGLTVAQKVAEKPASVAVTPAANVGVNPSKPKAPEVKKLPVSEKKSGLMSALSSIFLTDQEVKKP